MGIEIVERVRNVEAGGEATHFQPCIQFAVVSGFESLTTEKVV